MVTRKRTTPPEPSWQVILEDIRAQNRATIEAVEASRAEMNARFDQSQRQTDGRFTVVEAAIRDVVSDVRELKTDVKILKTDVFGLKTDLRRVEDKVDGLSPLEARVTALERSR